ncbi:hypothetical protein ULMS_13980 [Patiriisocius marinistellae]|uniref:Glycerophosphoryl diester phosphodiesterase membrane domain-containing protein n=1 Tax=Patiriisocius marinistellae TaxID=2494560 RepID=A0A5J4FV95_9FLAO|nr:hypothetical protein [Patiriisocius marinistellae]GEQ85890.1 hypothetical protein ULMS_13980 [Patiriisocius marinistellae]
MLKKDFIELKQKRDIGDAVSTFFDFFKQNVGSYFNLYIRYNGLFIIGLLGVSYLLVTGFLGMVQSSVNYSVTGENPVDAGAWYVGFGAIAFVLIFLITGLINYSLAASYMIEYENNKTIVIDKKDVWIRLKKNIGKTILFMVLLILTYIGVAVVGAFISFIPILGTLAYYVIILGWTAWMGLSFMSMFYEEKDVTSALGEGWNLLFKFFWKNILTNLVISLLLGILLVVVLMIPGILISIYVFHAAENDIDLMNSSVAKVIWIIALTIVLFIFSFNQSLAQFVNGILFFSNHEETYNHHTREKIEQIGAGE